MCLRSISVVSQTQIHGQTQTVPDVELASNRARMALDSEKTKKMPKKPF